MPSVELIAVGTELLLGQLVDTNTAHVASRLSTIGVDVHATHGVGDNLERIAAVISGALERADGVVTTGGLGPTVDDLDEGGRVLGLGLDTVLDQPSLEFMQAIFKSFGREMRENNRKQARDAARGCGADESEWDGAGVHRVSAGRAVRRVHAGRASRDEADARRPA